MAMRGRMRQHKYFPLRDVMNSTISATDRLETVINLVPIFFISEMLSLFPLFNCCTSLPNGFVEFVTLGYMAAEKGSSIE
ncbi:hypothetical protein EGR_08598 [Echinococcus granulosus]|uniref:Uncharacterized protein n=1 Tax=Echinococcus granulosus TaxID=6210 RepID=W6U5Y8_ECHGR|nr:hypothetical protein EGR_08598 [Echinococcus granulosus]EUB56525.1 hypothetical protein EGR_08598 [Echinococcus granulosus]